MASDAPQDAPQQTQSNPDEAVLPDEVSSTINAALEPFSDAALDATMPLAISAVAGEIDFSAVVRTAVQRTGLEPKDAEQRVNFVMGMYTQQASTYLANQGIAAEDMDSFFEFAREQREESVLPCSSSYIRMTCQAGSRS